MFCTACANQNPTTLLRCATCGASLRNELGSIAGTSTQTHPHLSRRRHHRFRSILAIVPLIVIALAGTISIRAYQAERATLAAAYERAGIALAAGDYSAAISAYAEAGHYRDAKSRRAEAIAAVEPIRATYITGANAFGTGDYELAIAALNQVIDELPDYEDAGELLSKARKLRTNRLNAEVQTAEADRDWLRAERALTQLLAVDPGNAELLAHYSLLARTHSPMVFARDGAIYLISPDMFDEQLVTDEVEAALPVWSPDRSKIAFIGSDGERDPSYALYIVNPDGADLRLLVRNVRFETWPVWSPEGTRIAFSSVRPFEFSGEHGISSLQVVDIDSGIESDYTSSAFHFVGSPSWSPDGFRIAFVAKQIEQHGPALGRNIEGSVQLLDTRTGEIAELAKGHFLSAVFVTWSPRDDLLLVLSSDVGSGWYELQMTTIDLIDLRTGIIDTVAKKSLSASYPVWSPDGSRFAFAEGNDLIQVRSVTGAIRWINVPRDITPFISWSLDGSAFFAPSNSAGRASLIISLDGSETADVPLVFSQSGPPRWSPVNLEFPTDR